MTHENLELMVNGKKHLIPMVHIHTLVLGSGAAGLNAAAQLYINGIRNLMIITEGLSMGTSINTGSDKQTYYKLSLCGDETDSPKAMADTYFANGSMHGDLALVESSLSVRCFINLVNLGVPFPRDEYGQIVGYKTDHDPRQRATSIGPYTSKEMCLRLIDQVKAFGIEIREGRNAVELLTTQGENPRIVGLVAVSSSGEFEIYICENLIFAVGGPGGLYKTSVYPPVHSGAVGLGLLAGACAANLPESQYGLASTKFRWNVSGTYMQVIPRIISRNADGFSDEQEFLPPFFKSTGEMNGMVFLKGYQWPFDARKAIEGSSIIDILVYIETMIKGRRVFLDFRTNPNDFSFSTLPDEARTYLEKSGALQGTPIDRLLHMNPGAVDLYQNHKINLKTEILEVAVCAQHNNGGLAGNLWYESTNIKHLFPVGEVNGSHGVTRPGGSALNAGQVAGFRAAEYIANRYSGHTLIIEEVMDCVSNKTREIIAWAELCLDNEKPWLVEMEELQNRMSQTGAHIRNVQTLKNELTEAWEQVRRIQSKGVKVGSRDHIRYAFRVRQLAFAQAVYLDAIKYALESGVGSRGSSIVLNEKGQQVHEMLDKNWKISPEDPSFRMKVLETRYQKNGNIEHRWIPCRPIPESDSWFETTWARFRKGDIYS
ncbi:MAG: FAD-binding protein [Chloroflexi bacterium]|nr:FAD-binding protein [Chloroflexota bacterium]